MDKVASNINLTVRILRSQDIKALCEFERKAHLTEPEVWIDEFDEKQYESKLREIKLDDLKNNKIIIVEENGVIVGRCDVSISLSLFNFENTGYIDWIYVLKEKRGQGIGKKLLSGAEKCFKRLEAKRFYLFTAENKQAQSFYHKQDLDFAKREVTEKTFK